MTVPEVAAHLSVSVSSIYRAIRQGSLPSYQIMGSVRISPRDLAVFLRRASGSPPPALLEAAPETLGVANVFGLKGQDAVPATDIRWFCTLESYARQEKRLKDEQPWHEARTLRDYVEENDSLERLRMLIPRQFRVNSERYLEVHLLPTVRSMKRTRPFELSAGFFGLDAAGLEGFGLLTSSVLIFDTAIARIFPVPPTPLPPSIREVDLGALYPYAMTLDAVEPHFAEAIRVFTETFDYVFERLSPADIFTIHSEPVEPVQQVAALSQKGPQTGGRGKQHERSSRGRSRHSHEGGTA